MNPNGSCSVLIVEDDASIAEFVQSVLCDEGYEAETARTGQEALRLAEQTRPGLVLLDLLLPGMSGATLLQELQQRYGDSIRVILMTASREEAAQPGRAGVSGVLLKPFELTNLLQEVSRVLGEPTCAG